jgi:hypothetical protein
VAFVLVLTAIGAVHLLRASDEGQDGEVSESPDHAPTPIGAGQASADRPSRVLLTPPSSAIDR